MTGVVDRALTRAPSSQTSTAPVVPLITTWNWTSCQTPALTGVVLVTLVGVTSFR